MRYYHTKCGGEIDVKKRQCTRCKKKWDPISFRLDPVSIRPMLDKKGKPLPDKVKGYKVEEKPLPSKLAYIVGVPYLDTFVSKLPKWPRWARILVSAAVIALIVILILVWR
jgi:hypothetical protein